MNKNLIYFQHVTINHCDSIKLQIYVNIVIKNAFDNSEMDGNGESINPTDNLDINILKVIQKLSTRRRKLIILTFIIISSILSANSLYKRKFSPVYSGGFTLLVSDPINTSKTGNSIALASEFENLALGSTDNDLPTLIELLKSSFFLEDIAAKYSISMKELQNRLNITVGGDPTYWRTAANGILQFKFISTNPVSDKLLLQDLSKTYLSTVNSMRQERLSEGLNFLNKQEPLLQEKVNKIQDKLKKLRIDNSLIEPLNFASGIEGELKRLDNVLGTLETEKNRLNNVRSSIEEGNIVAVGFDSNISTNIENNNFGGKSAGLSLTAKDQNLLNELLKIDKELSIARSTYTKNSKIIKSIEERRDRLKPILINNQIEAVETALRLNSSKIKTVALQKENLKERFSKTPELLREYEAVYQKLEIAKKNLLGLATARENFQLEIAQTTVPWKIIDPPFISPIIIKPNVKRDVGSAILIGILVGYLVAFIRDKVDNVFHNIDEIREFVKLPILSTIPYIDDTNNLFLENESDDLVRDGKQYFYGASLHQEAFRNLYTSIRFLNSEDLKIIALTSSIPSEGKTLIASNFSKTLSDMGQKILLIDADLRKPSVHKVLNIDNFSGLSNILTSDIKSWKKNLISMSTKNVFDVITSGIIPPDAPRLLSSARFKQLLEDINSENYYDLIIIDNTPFLGLSDAKLVSDNVDGVMLVASLNNVKQNLLKDTINSMSQKDNKNKINLLGLIANEKSYKKFNSNFYSYSYNYNYGYLYGENSENIKKSFFDSDIVENEDNPNLKTKILIKLKRNKFLEKVYTKTTEFLKWLDK